MKCDFKKITSIIILLIYLTIIFIMSTDFGASEGKTNQTIVETVKTQTGIDMNKRVGSLSINEYLRKNLHFLEFAVLGLLTLNLLRQYDVKHRYIFALVFSFLYAVTDELHQMFEYTRTALFTDVLIDTCGAALVIAIAFMISRRKASKDRLIGSN